MNTTQQTAAQLQSRLDEVEDAIKTYNRLLSIPSWLSVGEHNGVKHGTKIIATVAAASEILNDLDTLRLQLKEAIKEKRKIKWF